MAATLIPTWLTGVVVDRLPPALGGFSVPVFLSDFSTTIHSLTGHVGAVDDLMRVTANYFIYASLLILAALWFRRSGLRGGLAVGIGALLALGIGQLLGRRTKRGLDRRSPSGQSSLVTLEAAADGTVFRRPDPRVPS
jgi:hypothetical protein